MINAINIPQQIVAPNQNVLFAANRIKTGCPIRHDAGSGLFTITKPGLYKVHFNGSVLSTVANQDVQLAIEVDGEAIQAAKTHDTITTTGSFRSVSVDIPVRVPCSCCLVVSVGNLSTLNVALENANIINERVG